jgi:hypothetical protein
MLAVNVSALLRHKAGTFYCRLTAEQLLSSGSVRHLTITNGLVAQNGFMHCVVLK